MIRGVYRWLSALLLARHVASGNPARVGKFLLRRQAHKTLAKALRKL